MSPAHDARPVQPCAASAAFPLAAVATLGCVRAGADGTSSPARSQERPGDGASPGVCAGRTSPRSRRKKRRRPRAAGRSRPGRTAREQSGVPRVGRAKEGGTAGPGRPAASSLRRTATRPARRTARRRSDRDVPPGPRPGRPARHGARGPRVLAASATSSTAASSRPRDGEPWVFYEGPPTANGMPGTHHVEARVFKDVFPRYQTMKGRHVPRKAGWDCHGLPGRARRREASSASPASRTSRRTASPSSTPAAASRSSGTSTSSRR